MAYAIIRTDAMSGTTNPEDLVSLKCTVALQNGSVVKVGGLVSGEREVRSCSTPAKADALETLAILGSEEIKRDKAKYSKDEFTNEVDSIARGYRLGKKHQIFSVTKEAISGTPAKDSLVELDGTTKLAAVASATSGSTTVGKIIAVEGDWYVIEVGA